MPAPPPGGPSSGGARGGRGGGPAGRGRKRFVDYPRFGRRGFARWIPSWKLVGSLLLAGTGLVVGLFLAAYAATPIPDGKQSATYQTTTVYYRDGSVLGKFQEENRTLVSIKQVPDSLRYAVFAAEDRSFMTNSGISVTGMIRALLNNAQGGSLQGGSTITQQYVKNYYLSSDRTYTRKAKELFIALKVGRKFTKDQILEGYLNTIYFGRGANGVQAASKAYFNKDVSKLTKSESAYLAGIINGPELYDPYDTDSRPRAVARWKFVVDGEVAQGWLTADEASKMTFPKIIKNQPPKTLHGYQGYLLQMVRKEAANLKTADYPDGIDPHTLDTGGFDIWTSFDPKFMKLADQSVADALPDPKTWPKGTRIAMATIDVATGEVRSIYGGEDFLERQQNGATQDIMQAGSTAKPFALLAALRGKQSRLGSCRPTIDEATAVNLRTRFDGSSPQRFPGVEKPVRNFGGEQYGFIDLRKATASSVNTVYVALNEQIGPKQTRDAAICAGLPETTSGLDPVKGTVPANVLGTFSPHPVDMAFAYSTIANNGKRTTRHVLTKIALHKTKKQVYSFKAKPVQVFDPNVTANAIEAMQQVVTNGSGAYASRLGRPAAGKTGTSSNNMSAWFVGFTPQYATAVAMYRDDADGNPIELKGFGRFGEIVGGSYPVRAWTDFMSQALDGQPVKDFPAADPIGTPVNPEPPSPTGSGTPTSTQSKTPTTSPSPTPTDTPTTTGTPSPTDPPTTSGPPTSTGSPSPTRTRRGQGTGTATVAVSP